MGRRPNDLTELGTVIDDTAGDDRVGIETGGKLQPLGPTQD